MSLLQEKEAIKKASAAQSVTETSNNSKENIASKKNKKSRTTEEKFLYFESNVKTLALKFYEEQLPQGSEAFFETVHNVPSEEYQVLAITHDKDLVGDDFWEAAVEKKHFHVIVRKCDNGSFRVSTILNMLGIVYRRGLDDDLWKHHGAETTKNFTGYANYLTHETAEAMAEGKYIYEINEIISNQSIEMIRRIRDGYIRPDRSKVDEATLIALDKEAYERGLQGEDFDEWFHNLSFTIRRNCGMKTIKESYQIGLKKCFDLHKNENVPRVCLFVQGLGNDGKTTACRNALVDAMGITADRIEIVGSAGTGKFDYVNPRTEAIVIDDDTSKAVLSVADTHVTRLYGRGTANNPIWMGRYCLITSNKEFEDFMKDCGASQEHIKAAKTRFFIVKVEDGFLSIISTPSRGNIELLHQIKEDASKLLEYISNSIEEYHKMKAKNEDFEDLKKKYPSKEERHIQRIFDSMKKTLCDNGVKINDNDLMKFIRNASENDIKYYDFGNPKETMLFVNYKQKVKS